MRTERRRARRALAASAVAAAIGAACGDGGDEACGPGGAPADGVALTIAGVAVRYGEFVSSPNNDCTAGSVTSLTVEGRQVDAPERPIVLCLPAPDALGADPVDLADERRVQLIDVYATVGGCAVSLDRGAPPDGTAGFPGLCGDGTDPAGYALELDGAISVRRTCGDAIEVLDASLAGAAAVVAE